MKKQTDNKLEFNKRALVELNRDTMMEVAGGTSTTIFVVTATVMTSVTLVGPDGSAEIKNLN